jgi:hypothetical protein
VTRDGVRVGGVDGAVAVHIADAPGLVAVIGPCPGPADEKKSGEEERQ